MLHSPFEALRAACALFTIVVAATLRTSHAVEATFPAEIPLYDPRSTYAMGRPAGIVADVDTFVRVGTVAGQILRVDLKEAVTTIQNPGGDDQTFGGICLDSRPPTTLYATGRTTGKLYAFDAWGRRVRTYQIDAPDVGFLSSCIQTQYQLLIIDSRNSHVYHIPLSDDSLDGRGEPAATDEFEGQPYQAYKVALDGDWEFSSTAAINAYGVEWTQNFQRTTAFILNSGTGKLYSIPVSQEGVNGDAMRQVNVTGDITTFKGAMGIRFDSMDERVIYIAMPHMNSLAVLEILDDADSEVKLAKFIRFIRSALMNGPIGIGEFGYFRYTISMNPRQSDGNYTLVRLPRHQPYPEDGEDFSPGYNSTEYATESDKDPEEVWQETTSTPGKTGRDSPEEVSPDAPPPSATPSPTTSASITTETISSTPVAAAPEEDDSADEDNPPEIFSGEEAPSVEESGSCFPSDATVELRDGSKVRMDQLAIGDVVLSEPRTLSVSVYSRVYAFSHQDMWTLSKFIVIRSKSGHGIKLTEGHFINVNGQLQAARRVRVGDRVILGNGAEEDVMSVEYSYGRGLFNPHTLSGNIVVNGVVVSTFTEMVKPVSATALLAPLRAADRLNLSCSNKVISDFFRFGFGSAFSSYTRRSLLRFSSIMR